MVTKLNSSAPAGEKSGGYGWLIGIGLVVGALLGYEFWWKPKKEAEQASAGKSKGFDINQDGSKNS